MMKTKSTSTKRFFVRRALASSALLLGFAVAVPVMAPQSTMAADVVGLSDLDQGFRKARALYDQGNLDESEAILRQIVKIQPSHTPSRAYLQKIADKRAEKPDKSLDKALAQVTIPEVVFEKASLKDAVNYMREKVPELLDAKGQGDLIVNFVIFDRSGAAEAAAIQDLNLRNISVTEFIKYVSQLSGFTPIYRENMIEFRPSAE